MDQATISAVLNTPKSVFNLATTQIFLAGNTTSPAYATSTIISTQAGWIANVQVMAAGSAAGFIYNTTTFAGAVDARKLMPIQTTLGLQHGFCNFDTGMVMIPGPGQLVSVTYSLQQSPVQT